MDNGLSADRRELRRFGLTIGALIALLFGLILPSLREHHLPVWPWVAGAILVLGGLLRPAALRYVYAAWTALGHALGWLNSRIVLTIVFYVLIVPMGVVLKLFGRDPMARRWDPKAESYWVPSRRAAARNIERPY